MVRGCCGSQTRARWEHQDAPPAHFLLVQISSSAILRRKIPDQSHGMNWKNCLSVLALGSLAGWAAPAQSQVAVGSPPGWNAAMTRLFGDIKAFTARAELRVLDKAGKESITLPMNFALLDRRVRMDIDMSQMKGPQVPPEQIANLKQMAMDRLACVILPDTKTMEIIFPALSAYVEM